jgi:ABC-type transporter Mla MlaB component
MRGLAAAERPSARSVGAPRSPPGPSAAVFVLGGRIARADIPALCERARASLEGSDVGAVVFDVAGLVDPDAVTVDALARLQLTAQRLGGRLRLRHAFGELQDLIALMGLTDALPPVEPLRLEPRRQVEEREQARRVEEEADPGDPTL